MLKENELHRSVPSAEYDHRAREARRRAEQLEQEHLGRDAATVVRVFRVFRRLSLSVAGGHRGDDTTGSLNDQRPCDISMAAAPSYLKLMFCT